MLMMGAPSKLRTDPGPRRCRPLAYIWRLVGRDGSQLPLSLCTVGCVVQSEKDCHEHRGDSSKEQRVGHGTIRPAWVWFFFGRNREDSVGSKLGGM